MDNEIQSLIATFKEYRDLITPIEQSLTAFSSSFENIKNDIQNISKDFDSELKHKLDTIYKNLSNQSQSAQKLSNEMDKFLSSTSQYVTSVDSLIKICEKLEKKISTINEIENKAEQQIEKLDDIIEDKRKSYDIKQLEKKLEQYNVGVEKISEYIDTSVSDALKSSNDKISLILDKNNNIYDNLQKQNGSIENLIKSYEVNNKLLKQFVENKDITEEYVFDILDKWAIDRKLKIKK